MGFFSKLCAKTHLPVMSEMAGIPELSLVVALMPNGDVLTGVYDGYGRVGNTDLQETGAFDRAKFVLKKFYTGESYAELGASHDDHGQGWFYDSENLNNWLAQGGFASYSVAREEFDRCWAL